MPGKLVDTHRGKRHKYEIYRNEGLMSPNFNIYRDGEYWKGSYSSLSKAHDAAVKGN